MPKMIEKLELKDLRRAFQLYCMARGLDKTSQRLEWNVFFSLLNMNCTVVDSKE